ncbi:MAG: DUF952 domain-containing protein [Cyanosarcina radialis HA8281-LM2]|jgi:uncharacterized protein (DUF952 family)|nr:DUF952 domain-containing protein [Cyanosarcina radialis HA8281-LM2]
MKYVYHITEESLVAAAKITGIYTPIEFDKDKFIHCSYEGQVQRVANYIFKGRLDLVVLEIDREKLIDRLIDENLEGGEELFPHLYSVLPWNAVLNVFKIAPDCNGLFQFNRQMYLK